MKVILYMAMSVNGMIADNSGSEDFLSNDGWLELERLANEQGSLVWGRTTYEAVRNWDKSYFKNMQNIKKFVLSSKEDYIVDPGYTLVNSPEECVQKATEAGVKGLILTGGAKNNSSFAKLGLIDEVILNVEPAIAGNGVGLFAVENFMLKLELLDMRKINPNLIQLHYKVIRAGNS